MYYKEIIIYIIIIAVSFLVGLSIRLNYAKSSLIEGVTCDGEICPLIEEHEDVNRL